MRREFCDGLEPWTRFIAGYEEVSNPFSRVSEIVSSFFLN